MYSENKLIYKFNVERPIIAMRFGTFGREVHIHICILLYFRYLLNYYVINMCRTIPWC